MDFILSKIISRPARNAHDNCDMTATNSICESSDTNLVENRFSDNPQLLSDTNTVKRMQLIVYGSMAKKISNVLILLIEFDVQWVCDQQN